MVEKGVAAIGECMLELSGQGGANWRMGFAGDTLNTLWALKALTSRPASYVTAFGDDPFSRDQLDFFKDNGIGTASSPTIAGARPGLYAITLTGAERSFTYWRADSAARQLASNPAALRKSLENQELVYFSGITLAILESRSRRVLLDAVAAARAAGSRIAFDANYRPRLWATPSEALASIDAALRVSDIALPTFPDEQMLAGDASPRETAERLSRAGVTEIVVKNGNEAALVVSGGQETMVPPLTVVPVDTTGAGDGFNGAYLAARISGYSPVEATKRAHAVAAAVIQVRGALAPPETLRAAFDN